MFGTIIMCVCIGLAFLTFGIVALFSFAPSHIKRRESSSVGSTGGGGDWSIFAFMSTAARNGLTAIIPALGENSGLAIISDTNFLKFNRNCYVVQIGMITAAIANLLRQAWGLATDKNLATFVVGMRQQTAAHRLQDLIPLKRALGPNDKLTCQGDNQNNAAYECGLAIVSDTPREVCISLDPSSVAVDLSKLHWIRLTYGAILVAATWTNLGAITATSEEFDTTKTYKIKAMEAQSATGYAARVISLNKSVKARPGIPASDVLGTADGLWYGDFGPAGTFKGDAVPQFEMLASAGDTAETLNLGVEISG